MSQKKDRENCWKGIIKEITQYSFSKLKHSRFQIQRVHWASSTVNKNIFHSEVIKFLRLYALSKGKENWG